ncbi:MULTISPECIES: DnaD domain protein [Enterococcus]|uniref:DNA replication protein DnaD n=1 Tax=Enterococcus alcedinis TaxID=1274384 RepID=A0A917N3X0_9ENTE|nr:DnaD domain protein [Enterococcus alcedinis]MBP2100851.1 DNA replication protein [Enterococcus alcedinis]GGI64851.1 DNA replication protein DnaD [Enterococcus alcedinis]
MIRLDKFLKYGQTSISNLILEYYRQIGLSNEEFLLWLQLHRYYESGNHFPDLGQIAKQMHFSQQEVYYLLNQLVEKQCIQIVSLKDKRGMLHDSYDLTPVYQRLSLYLEKQVKSNEVEKEQEKIGQLYQSFEAEFSRPLSPMEYQRIGQWLEEDKYQVELIQLALREAVLNQVYSLNYVDRILLSWERKNIRTSAQVKEEQQKRKRQIMQKEEKTTKALPKVSLHNWLEEE